MFNKEGYIIPEKKLQQYKSTPVREWQGLTDEDRDQIKQLVFEWEGSNEVVNLDHLMMATENALKEKNHGV
jgi:hypothetical protein